MTADEKLNLYLESRPQVERPLLCQTCRRPSKGECCAMVRRSVALNPYELRAGDLYPLYVPGVKSLVRNVRSSFEYSEDALIVTTSAGKFVILHLGLLILVERLVACSRPCCELHAVDRGDGLACVCMNCATEAVSVFRAAEERRYA
jgi:hypothetical protein